MKSKKNNLTYEPDADVLMWELNNNPIDYATEIGNVVVHFGKDNIPVLMEVLNARSFLKHADALLGKNEKIAA